jgi:hypothetical protein
MLTVYTVTKVGVRLFIIHLAGLRLHDRGNSRFIFLHVKSDYMVYLLIWQDHYNYCLPKLAMTNLELLMNVCYLLSNDISYFEYQWSHWTLELIMNSNYTSFGTQRSCFHSLALKAIWWWQSRVLLFSSCTSTTNKSLTCTYNELL